MKDNEPMAGEAGLDAAIAAAYDNVTSSEPSVAATEENEILEAETPTVEETPPNSGKEKAEAAKPIDPPSSWTAEAKEKFSKLPPELQEYVAKRESEREGLLTKKSTEYSEQQRKYEALEQILAPRRQALAAMYGGEAQALGQLFALSDYASKDPEGFVKWFAQQRGINLQSAQPATETDEYADPATVALKNQLHNLTQTVQSLTSNQATERTNAVRAQIDSFRDEKDDKGNVVHQHFDKVRGEMAALMNSGAAKDLKHAYDMAVYANPEVRKIVLEEREKAAEEKRLKEAAEAAAKAKKAAGTSVPKKAGVSGAKASTGSWEDTVSEITERVFNAA